MNNSLRHAWALAALFAATFSTTVNAAGPRLADPAAAESPVPATRYELRDLATSTPVATPSPSQNWQALNQVVASYDSMSLTMDMAEAAPADAKVTETSGARVSTPLSVQDSHQPAAPPAAINPHAQHKSGTVK